MFPSFFRFLPIGLLLLRLMVGIVFIDSGWNDLRSPRGRSKSIGKSKGFTIFLGIAEVLGGVAVVLGIWFAACSSRSHACGLGSDLRKNCRVAHWILGRENIWLALRSYAPGDESGCCRHEWRFVHFAQMIREGRPGPKAYPSQDYSLLLNSSSRFRNRSR
jgi:DoxX